jgi:hypothetical protein
MPEAEDEVRKRRDFTAHAITYVLVNAALVAIWAITGAGYFWPAWVLLGWGVGLALNAWDVFFRRPITESEIEREVARVQGVDATAR